MRTERHPNGAVTSVALRLALFLAAGVWFLPAPAAAQVTWTGTTSSNWDVLGNWANSIAPVSGGSGGLAFNATSNVAVTATNNLASYTASSITFNTGSFTLSGSAVTLSGSISAASANRQYINLNLSLGSDGTNRTFDVASSGTLGIVGNLSGTANLVKTGAGMLQLTGTNDFTGNITVQAGQLRIGTTTTGLAPSGTIALQGSGQLVFGYSSGSRTFTNTIITSATAASSNTSNGTLSIWGAATNVFQGNQQVYQVKNISSATGTTTFQGGKLSLGGTFATGTLAPTFDIAGGPVFVTSTIGFGPGMTNSNYLTKTGAGTLYVGNAAASDLNKLSVGGGTLDIVGTLQGTFKNGGIQFTGTGDNVLQMSGTYTPSGWGGTNFQVGWNKNNNDGGFAARTAPLTVTLIGSGTVVKYQDPAAHSSSGFLSSGRTLIFGSPTADDVVTFTNPIDLNSGTQTIKVIGNANANNYAVLSGALSNGGLTKDGTGLLRLTGTNTYAGATAVNSGTLAIGSAGQLVGTTGTYAGDMTVAASTAFQYDSSVNSSLSGAISGSGAVIQTGAGRLTLLGANSYSGGTTLSAGTLEFANGGLGSTGNVTLNGGTLRWATGNTQDISARLALVSGSTATLDTNNNTVTLGSGFGGNTSASLTKAGLGTLVLSASNTYTGATTVNSGTLQAASNALANTSSITVNGATLSAVNYNSSASLSLDSSGLATISGTGLSLGTVTNNNTTANALDFSSKSGTITLASLSGAGNTRFQSSATINGGVSQGTVTATGLLTAAISGGSVTAGSLSASGVSGGSVTTTGAATITTLSAGSVSAGGVATITTMSGGTAGLNGATASITTLSGGQINLANNVALSVQAGTFGGTIAGTGSLKKTGAGRLTLTASQSYTGSTIISGGTVALGAGVSLASSQTIVVGNAGSAGAVLDLTAQGGAGSTVTFNADQKVMGKGTIDLAGATLRVLGTLAPGNSPGTLTINGDLQWQSSDAGYQWEINDATGNAGTNWDLLAVNGVLDLSHLSASAKYKLDLTTLTSSNTAGLMANYVDGDSYTWSLVTASSVLLASGTAAAGTDITSLFTLSFANWANPAPSAGNYSVKVASDGAGINLVIIPEPGTIIFAGIGIAMAGWSLWKRRRILQK